MLGVRIYICRMRVKCHLHQITHNSTIYPTTKLHRLKLYWSSSLPRNKNTKPKYKNTKQRCRHRILKKNIRIVRCKLRILRKNIRMVRCKLKFWGKISEWWYVNSKFLEMQTQNFEKKSELRFKLEFWEKSQNCEMQTQNSEEKYQNCEM